MRNRMFAVNPFEQSLSEAKSETAPLKIHFSNGKLGLESSFARVNNFTSVLYGRSYYELPDFNTRQQSVVFVTKIIDPDRNIVEVTPKLASALITKLRENGKITELEEKNAINIINGCAPSVTRSGKPYSPFR